MVNASILPNKPATLFAIQQGLAPFNSLDIERRYIVTSIGVNSSNSGLDT